MRILAGTSGYAFKEWKGSFYPADLKDDGWLGYYAGRFPSVEINNTFYRLPKETVLRDWASRVPEHFTFAIKASQRITHYARLKEDAASPLEYLLRTTSALGSRLGPILFQLPPNLKKDLPRLRGFLGLLPRDRRFAIEFRHESWFVEPVYKMLRAHDAALVIGDHPRWPFQARELTTDWTLVRLHHGHRGRRGNYSETELDEWAQRIAEWRRRAEVLVYFNNDWEGFAVENGLSLMRRLRRSPAG